MRSISKLVISALVVTPLAIGVGPALAATTDEISSVIVDKTLAGFGVEVTDAELLSSLADDLGFAIDSDLINNDIVDEVNNAFDSGTDASLDDNQDANETDAVDEFENEKTNLELAFEAIKLEFQQCREQATGGARECAAGLGVKMQIAISEDLLATIQAKEAALAGLTGDELAAAEAELAELQKRLENRTLRIAQQLVRLQERTQSTDVASDDVAKLEQLEVRVQEKVKSGVGAANSNSGRSASPTPSSTGSGQSMTPGTTNGNSSNSNSGNGSNGKSNSGNSSNGKSNGKSVSPSPAASMTSNSTGSDVSE